MSNIFALYSLFGNMKDYFESPANPGDEPYVIMVGIAWSILEARCRRSCRLLEVIMHSVVNWFSTGATIIALVITAAVAIFLVCCMECTKCPKKDKDEIFTRHEL